MNDFDPLVAFKYGGTLFSIESSTFDNTPLWYDVLDTNEIPKFLFRIVKECENCIDEALKTTKLSLDKISCVGIVGFNAHVNKEVLDKINWKHKSIDSLKNKGFLGSVGPFEIMHRFFSSNKYSDGDIMMLISLGFSPIVEVMIVKK